MRITLLPKGRTCQGTRQEYSPCEHTPTVTSTPPMVPSQCGVSLKSPKPTRPPPRMEDATGTNWTTPGVGHANKAWAEFRETSKGFVQKDRRQWVRVLEYQKNRKVPHVHALITAPVDGLLTAPGPLAMKEWAFKKSGIARVLPYDPTMGAAGYLGKYLLKEEGNARGMLDIDSGGFKNV